MHRLCGHGPHVSPADVRLIVVIHVQSLRLNQTVARHLICSVHHCHLLRHDVIFGHTKHFFPHLLPSITLIDALRVNDQVLLVG